jgi:two-component system phosphate regulon sensor histidine kinase PhoR
MFSLKNKLIAIISLITIIAFASSWFLLSGIWEDRIVKEAGNKLEKQVTAFGDFIEGRGLVSLEREIKNWRGMIGGRITVIEPDGKVLKDSDIDPSSLDNHANRPEIREAFEKGSGKSLRYSRSLDTDLLYYAKKIETEGGPSVLRIAYPLESLRTSYIKTRNAFIVYFVFLILIVIALEFWMVKRFFKPLDRIVEVASAISIGEDGHFPIMKDPELQRLSNALDTMSENLKATVEKLNIEQNLLSSIVTLMPTGAILLDKERKIKYFNETALKLLGIESGVETGDYIERHIPYSGIYTVMEKAEKGEKTEEYLEIPERNNRYLRVSATGSPSGLLLVLTDMTREKELEEARKDFVADAGHELQTPLTAIRAASEYLLEDLADKKDAVKNLNIIIKQQERITGLVDDLLLLSKMENQPDANDFMDVDLSSMLRSLVEEMNLNPFVKNMEVESSLPDGAEITGNPDDLKRAYRNLLDNAIKYVHKKFGIEKGGRISINLYREDSVWITRIADNGTGIDDKAVNTIYERFRRGDKHRARYGLASGGYGLGLAIAKRVFESHRGRIVLLKGTGGAVFEISLPVAEKDG